MDFFVRRSETLHGPYTAEKIARAVIKQKLKPSDFVGISEKGPWIFISDLADSLDQESEIVAALRKQFGDSSQDDFDAVYAEVLSDDASTTTNREVNAANAEIPFESSYSPSNERVTLQHRAKTRAQFEKSNRGFGKLFKIAGILIVIMLAICGVIGAFVDTDEMTAAGARVNAEYYVRSQLKSPTSAVFSNTTAKSIFTTTTTPKWEVKGTVDSQNSFGAMIRSSWSVVVHDLPDDGVRFSELMISP